MLSRNITKFGFGAIEYKGLEKWGVKNRNIKYNLGYSELYESGL